MAADDLVGGVADRAQEIIVGAQHGAVDIEFDDGRRPFDGLDHRLLASRFVDLSRGVAGKFDHLGDLAAAIEDGVVGCLQPDVAAALLPALDQPLVEVAAPQLVPKGSIVGAGGKCRVAEQTVFAANQFVGSIAYRPAEVIVDRENPAIRAQLDDGQRTVKRGQYRLAGGEPVFELDDPFLIFLAEHGENPLWFKRI